MFQPKIVKAKKSQKCKNFRKINSILSISFGYIKLISMEPGLLYAKHFKVIKQTIKKFIKKKGVLYILKFPHTPSTKKPLAVRMGKGKGAIHLWNCRVGLGALICKIEIKNKHLGVKAMLAAKQKLPLLTKIILH